VRADHPHLIAVEADQVAQPALVPEALPAVDLHLPATLRTDENPNQGSPPGR